MKSRKITLKSVMVIALSLVLVLNALIPMSAFAETTDNYYTVKSGDTLAKIAASYGVAVADIVSLNSISGSAKIYPGQVLLMPRGAIKSGYESTGSSSYGTLSLSFSDVDLLAALSAILMHTNYTVVFKGASQSLTVALKNVTPLEAVDYVLRMVDMSYIKNGNTIFVGSASTLNSSFIDNATLAKFSLRYITTDLLASQLSTLGLSVNFVETTEDYGNFWVNAYPMELATIRELIQLLDIPVNLQIGSASIASNFSYIDLDYMNAEDFSGLLSQLGLHAGITLANFPMRLFIYTSGNAYDDIMRIKSLVDIPEAAVSATGDATAPVDVTGGTDVGTDSSDPDASDVTGGTGEGEEPGDDITDGVTTLKKLTLSCIEKSDVENIVSEFSMNVEVLGLDLLSKTVWLLGSPEDVRNAYIMISGFDVESLKTENTFFTYELQNIVASELMSRLEFLDTSDVQFYWGLYPTISHSVTIFCPEDRRDSIVSIIQNLDTTSTKLYVPVASASSEVDVDSLKLKINLLSSMVGISVDCFYFSGDLDSSQDGYRNVLYAYESPENIQLIKDTLASIDAA